ncbi:hypothetical protein A2U01_0061157, partial [Trifolium medium]|nr:hypothetical protein [Trifolium medium]
IGYGDGFVVDDDYDDVAVVVIGEGCDEDYNVVEGEG